MEILPYVGLYMAGIALTAGLCMYEIDDPDDDTRGGVLAFSLAWPLGLPLVVACMVAERFKRRFKK